MMMRISVKAWRCLKADHYDTFFATDAVSTLRQARKHEPDLIILDLGLPHGDGFVVIEKLKVWPSLAMIPIIVVSAQDLRANKERGSRQERRPISKNQWIMWNFSESFGRP
jgi:CheY-like chemotaxis protein